MKADWTELMFMQMRAGNTAIYVFLLAIVCVFLALAALYESWTLPLAVILVVPLCLLCSVAGVLATHRDVNIFVQIGLVVLVGLACKNAILIVEFARQLHEEGQVRASRRRVEASRLRLRPILMTSFAFIFGVVPLMIAVGRRGRNAAVARHRGVQRHARRDAVRHLSDAGVLLRDPRARRNAALRRQRSRSGSVSVRFGLLVGLAGGFLLWKLECGRLAVGARAWRRRGRAGGVGGARRCIARSCRRANR